MNVTQAQAAITMAKLRAYQSVPYLSHLCTQMRVVETDQVDTMAVDKLGRLYVKPGFCKTLTPGQVHYVLLHEMLHLSLFHHRRLDAWWPDATAEQRLAWNIGCDLVIQQMLADMGLEQDEPAGIMRLDGAMPSGRRFDTIPGLTRGMTAEQYAGLLYLEAEEELSKPGGGKGQPLDPAEAGSGSDGQSRGYEQADNGIDGAMVEAALGHAEQELATHAGDVAGNIRRAIGLGLRKQVDPFKVLTRMASKSVRSCVGDEVRTYRTLHRRQQAGQPRRMGSYRVRPECSIIIDTSGSMAGDEERALQAIADGVRAVQRPRVVAFDTKVQSASHITSASQFQFVGYGGTRMDKAIVQEDQEQRPDAILLVTDGETLWPSRPTRARLVVALTSRPCKQPPSWAKVVRLYEAEERANVC